jgi:hypothetical protein
MTNHQRIGAISNSHAGREFEEHAGAYFSREEGLVLTSSFQVEVGVSSRKKTHGFDLGSTKPRILVECKSHNWTVSGNMPSAKVTVWNEAMYYFSLAPQQYRKVLFVLEARHSRRDETLAEYYVRIYGHLVPDGVSIFQYDPQSRKGSYVLRG